MLTKAILTGGVLSVLAGSIVYFGTEGADALEREVKDTVQIEETELAGGAVSEAESTVIALEVVKAEAIEAQNEVAEAANVEAVVKTPQDVARQLRKEARIKARAEARATAKTAAEAKAAGEAEVKAEPEAIGEAEAEAKAEPEAAAAAKAEPEAVGEAEAKAEPEAVGEAETLEADSAVVAAAQIDPPKPKSKTRWLDQYLKSSSSRRQENAAKSEVTVEPESDVEIDEDIRTEVEVEIEAEVESEAQVVTETEVEAEVEAAAELESEIETGKKMMAKIEPETKLKTTKKKLIVKMDGDKKFVWSSDDENMELDEDFDMDRLENLLSEHAGSAESDSETKIRIIKRDGKKHKGKAHHKMLRDTLDYDAVLLEANKLQVIDMRNEAVLEIVDYAVDRRDFAKAADIVAELSSPELRDTARARIGVGLALNGDMEAGFAVLEEIEIDELTAPIRLEIIAALMATRAERAAQHKLR